jgi:HD-GYP domain-containing protein (c-di-GMP phosphodiesterase class II)
VTRSGAVPPTVTEAANFAGPASQVAAVLELARRDSELFLHGIGVGKLAERIALAFGVGQSYASRIRLAGVLHDIGKLAVPRAVLNKSGPLTETERRIVERHSSIGASMVQIGGLRAEARWIRHHHERIDGFGYPDRLAGHEIPLPSRIILVADAFDALTSDLPYQAARAPVEALAELVAQSDRQFDSYCVAALERALADGAAEPGSADF